MTALCGIYSPLNPPYATRELLEKMLRTMQHRGSNSYRQYVDEQSGFAMAAAFPSARSASLESARWYEDFGYVATVDGHIDNWRSLCAGDTYDQSEAAAIVALARDRPTEFPKALDGSFALVLWEKLGHQLQLVRDALGRKPLYYSVVETGALLFASEPKAILAHLAGVPSLNTEALSAYIAFGCLPAPMTLFQGVNKLFPGETLQVDSSGVSTKYDYWRMPTFEPYAQSLEELAGPIRDSLLETIKKQLRKAKRVGVLLSGGADSTILLGALKLLGIKDRHTFTLSHSADGLQVDNRDDCNWARTVATLHEATHHAIDVDASPGNSARLPGLLELFDDPIILENRVAGCDLLAREAAKHGIEVCLSGNNQKAFGGIWEWKTVRKLLATDAAQDLTTSELVLEANLNLFSKREHRSLLDTINEELLSVPASVIDRYLRGIEASDIFDVVAATSMRLRSPEQFIPFEERIAVISNIEICYPYFDPLLLGVANGIPARFRGSTDESMSLAALRWAFRDVLPHDVASRPKVAYPRDPWTDGKFTRIQEIFFSSEALARSNVFEPSAVRAILLASEARNNIRARRQLWTLLFFQVWFDCYLSGNGLARLEGFSSS